VTDDQLLILVDALIKGGDIPAAVNVAESNLAKDVWISGGNAIRRRCMP
jgi:hypothetical protein